MEEERQARVAPRVVEVHAETKAAVLRSRELLNVTADAELLKRSHGTPRRRRRGRC